MKLKRFLILILAIFILFNIIFYTKNFAANLTYGSMQNYMSNTSQGISSASSSSPIRVVVSTIIRFIQVAGSGYAVIKFTFVGIKYFTTSAAYKKAEGKGELVRALITAVIIFGAVGIFEIGYQALNP